MGKVLCEKATGKVVSFLRHQAHTFDLATHIEVDADDVPDVETQVWDGTTGLRPKTAQELADEATAKLDEDATRAIDDMKALKALVLWLSEKLAIAPATARSEIIAKYKSL